jgi:hypothetical protein
VIKGTPPDILVAPYRREIPNDYDKGIKDEIEAMVMGGCGLTPSSAAERGQ